MEHQEKRRRAYKRRGDKHDSRKYPHKRHYRDRERYHSSKENDAEIRTGNLLGSVQSDSCKYSEHGRDLNCSRDKDNHRLETESDLSKVLQADLESEEDQEPENYNHNNNSESAPEIELNQEIEGNDDECYNDDHHVVSYDENLSPYYPAIDGCRSLSEFQCLNRISEGTYGVVYRFRDKRTQEVVALKKLKMENEKEGFPRTSLREINTLLKGQHPNIVTVREIVVGSDMDKIFIVMDYVEHDLKSLIESMKLKNEHFTVGEVKCLLKQLLAAVAHLHDNWILHRDLKPANLLLSHNGVLKVGDFGLAREYGSPLKQYTSLVVTLWYRAPELLLGIKQYSTPIDVWSVGCIFAELLLMAPIFGGKSEAEQINRIFRCLGTPSEKTWKGYSKLPLVKSLKLPTHQMSNLRKRFQMLSNLGLSFLLEFLTCDPSKRISAEKALSHSYFYEFPTPIDPSEFTKWPAKSELGHTRNNEDEPRPPPGGGDENNGDDDGFFMGTEVKTDRRGAGFNLKF